MLYSWDGHAPHAGCPCIAVQRIAHAMTTPQPLLCLDVWTLVLLGMFLCLLVGLGYGIWWMHEMGARVVRNEAWLLRLERARSAETARQFDGAEEKDFHVRPLAQTPPPDPP